MARRIEYDGEPVITVDEVARQCRLEPEEIQTELVQGVIIPGVIGQCEARTGAAIRPAVYEDAWPEPYGSGRALDVGGAFEVTQVERWEPDGTRTLLNVLTVLEKGQRETLLFFPQGRPAGRLLIRYRAAVDLAAYPSVKQWLLMQAATAYEHRETIVVGTIVASLPTVFIDALLADITVPPRF